MKYIATGVWRSDDTFIPDNAEVFTEAMGNIMNLTYALVETIHVMGDDIWAAMSALGISQSLLDAAEFATVLHDMKSIRTYGITRKEYDRYQWMISVLRHSLDHGEVFWQTRTLLLDNQSAADGTILSYLERMMDSE